jgi:hypothetical protein
MKNASCSAPPIELCRGLSAAALVFLFLLAGPPGTEAGAPEWLRSVARAQLPSYPEETDAVLLLSEQITTVSGKGEIKTVVRRAYKILRPQGREHGEVVVYFDSETKLTFLKAWCIPARGEEYEVKEKDAVETSVSSVSLYDDVRRKILVIPAADPGNVVGYEYEQKRRPLTLQDQWWFQDPHPVRYARYMLQLPAGWEFSAFWANHRAAEPRSIGENRWLWEMEDLPAVVLEPQMPPWRAVAGWLAVTLFPPEAKMSAKTHGSWKDVGRWYAQLTAGRRQATPEIRQKVAELTAGRSTVYEKLRALAAFAQRDIRYVSIAIGIGGFQPHAAAEAFQNRYGDCKDKVTLLSSMLAEIGLESFYLLIHTERGVVAPDFPTPLTFNHVILAIRLPPEEVPSNFFATRDHPELGKLLFFDPTDEMTPLGYLPATLQANHGLLVAGEGGELVRLPLLSGTTNRLFRTAKLSLTDGGELNGEVQEIRWGSPAVERRAEFLNVPVTDRPKVIESFLGSFLRGFRINGAAVENLETHNTSLILRYRFTAESYAQRAGDLLLFRPRIVGSKGSVLLEIKERKYPVEFPDATLQTDQFEIALPSGYTVDELPRGVHASYPFAEYKSSVEVKDNVLHYQRTFEIKDVRVPVEKLDELKKFYRQVAADERASVVLKRASP